MKILLVSEFFLPRPFGGGVGRHLHDLAKNLSQQGDEVHILTQKLPGERGYSLPSGVRVIRKLLPSTSSALIDRVKGIYNSYNLLRNVSRIGEEFDIIHLHSMRIHFLHLLKISKPIIVTFHSIFPICPRVSHLHDLCKSSSGARCAICYANDHPTQILLTPGIAVHLYLHHKLMKVSLASVGKVVCVSQYIKRQIKNYFNIQEQKIIVIPNAVDIKSYGDSRVRAEDGKRKMHTNIATANEKIILFVGRLVYTKGVHILISAMPRILAKVDAKLLIVGQGDMKNSLKKQVDRIGLTDQVVFLDSVDDQTLRLLFSLADVSVVPSLYEPFGITAIEAFAARTPLVVADSGGLSEIVEHNKTGIKVIPNNARSLADGVMEILLDSSFAQSLSRDAFHEVKRKYSWNIVSQQIRSLYDHLK